MSAKQPKPEPQRNAKLKIELDFEDAVRAALEIKPAKQKAKRKKR